MIILFWAISVFIITIILGEIRFRHLTATKKNKVKINIAEWQQDIDKDILTLDLEIEKNNFVPMTKLLMRGSWRLAQNSVVTSNNISYLKEIEYKQKLR